MGATEEKANDVVEAIWGKGTASLYFISSLNTFETLVLQFLFINKDSFFSITDVGKRTHLSDHTVRKVLEALEKKGKFWTSLRIWLPDEKKVGLVESKYVANEKLVKISWYGIAFAKEINPLDPVGTHQALFEKHKKEALESKDEKILRMIEAFDESTLDDEKKKQIIRELKAELYEAPPKAFREPNHRKKAKLNLTI